MHGAPPRRPKAQDRRGILVVDMIGKLQQIMGQLQAAGVIRQVQTPPTAGRPN
jgi:hypothetical protein